MERFHSYQWILCAHNHKLNGPCDFECMYAPTHLLTTSTLTIKHRHPCFPLRALEAAATAVAHPLIVFIMGIHEDKASNASLKSGNSFATQILNYFYGNVDFLYLILQMHELNGCMDVGTENIACEIRLPNGDDFLASGSLGIIYRLCAGIVLITLWWLGLIFINIIVFSETKCTKISASEIFIVIATVLRAYIHGRVH